MEDWGKGMLMTGREYMEVHAFDEHFGVCELRAKVNGKAGVKSMRSPNRFSIDAEFNYGTNSIETVRKFLDSGILLQTLEKDFLKDDRYRDDLHRFITLVACAMTLGCKVPAKTKEIIHQSYPRNTRSSLAKAQLKKAITHYEDGIPYDFGNVLFLEATTTRMFPGKAKLKDMGPTKMIEITQSNGMVIPQLIGPPSHEEMGLENKRIYPAHVCGHCGAVSANHGKETGQLLTCAECHDRKYCSKQCQKKAWKLHKKICRIPKEQMEAFMASLVLVPENSGNVTEKSEEGGANGTEENDRIYMASFGDVLCIC